MIKLTVYCLLYTVHYPFTIIYDQWLKANSECMVNGEWLMVNGVAGGRL